MPGEQPVLHQSCACRDPSNTHDGTMMQHHAQKSIVLPVTEYARLQQLMLTMIGSRSALASMLRRKLGSARAVSAAIAGDVAVSGMRVRYRIDGQRVEERILTWQAPRRAGAGQLSLLSPRGLALLGLCPGESVTYRTERDRTEFLEVEAVSAAELPRTLRVADKPQRDVLDIASVPFTAPDRTIAGGQLA
jgi:hypothetical protein